MNQFIRLLALSVAASLVGVGLGAATALADTDADCRDNGASEALCHIPSPEDMVALPGGKHLLFSPFGGKAGENAQPLYLFDIAAKTAAPIALTFDALDTLNKKAPRWDDNLCDSAPTHGIGGHGIDIGRRADGKWQVLAVNHLRESVEMFEVVAQAGKPALAWRGCVPMPRDTMINDVALLPGGDGFLVTNMLPRVEGDWMPAMMAIMKSGARTGYVLRWRSGKGIDTLPGSESCLPNGVAISADGKTVFIAETGGRRVSKIDYASGRLLGQTDNVFPDNLTWAPDGRLIVSNTEIPPANSCGADKPACVKAFTVIAIDPNTLALTRIYRQQGQPLGTASVALVHDNFLYVGSFEGDRLMRVALKNTGYSARP